jgi:hypothetical protein
MFHVELLEETDTYVAGVLCVCAWCWEGAEKKEAFSSAKGYSLSNTICTTYLGPCGVSVTHRDLQFNEDHHPIRTNHVSCVADKINIQKLCSQVQNSVLHGDLFLLSFLPSLTQPNI